MRCITLVATSFLATLLIGLPVRAEETDAKSPEGGSGFQEIIPAQEAAVEKALAWLAKSQSQDGSWGSKDNQSYTMAMTGLTGLAFLSAGHSPHRGKYGAH